MKNTIPELVILTLVVGSFVLAVIDPTNRPLFADLAKVCVGAYIGRSLPGLKS